MNRDERLALMEAIEAKNIRELADMAKRRERRLADGVDWDTPPAPRHEPLIYKTFETPEPQAAPTMDERAQTRWNNWCDQRASAVVGDYADEIASIIGEETGITHKQLRDEIAELRHEVATLRAQVEGGVTRMVRGKAIAA